MGVILAGSERSKGVPSGIQVIGIRRPDERMLAIAETVTTGFLAPLVF